MAKPLPPITTASMADIAFMMLFFFLVTTTMDVELGLQRRLPPMPDENQQLEDAKVNRRNVLVVQINSSNRILAGGQVVDVNQLKDRVREFVLNPNNDPNLPEKKIVDVKNFGPYPVSQAVVSLQNDRGTTYDVYMKVQNELIKAYNELRDEFAIQNYGKPYLKLDEDQQEVLRAIYGQNISEAEPRDVGNRATRARR